MRYIDESLAPGETIIQRGRWPLMFWVAAWAALLLLGIVVVGIFIFIGAAAKMLTTDFAVTNRRVILKQGWLNRHTQELAVESVEGVGLDQSLWARLFGYGRIVVTGTGEARIVFPPMAHPVAFRRAIEAARAEGHGDVRQERVVVEQAPARAPPERAAPPRRKRGFIGLLTSR